MIIIMIFNTATSYFHEISFHYFEAYLVPKFKIQEPKGYLLLTTLYTNLPV
jgi:hypothetical protein